MFVAYDIITLALQIYLSHRKDKEENDTMGDEINNWITY